jgi:hypothetical protein
MLSLPNFFHSDLHDLLIGLSATLRAQIMHIMVDHHQQHQLHAQPNSEIVLDDPSEISCQLQYGFRIDHTHSSNRNNLLWPNYKIACYNFLQPHRNIAAFRERHLVRDMQGA